jgi:hypothetical protein
MKDIAYRGYLIRHNPMNSEWWIEKGGAFISYAADEADARTTINLLLD